MLCVHFDVMAYRVHPDKTKQDAQMIQEVGDMSYKHTKVTEEELTDRGAQDAHSNVSIQNEHTSTLLWS